MVRACVFDAYGTLFDVHSAAARHADAVGPAAEAVSKTWRTKQLEYTWVRSLMHRHVDFWACTVDALDFALSANGLAKRPDLAQLLLGAYRALSPFPEVRGVLEALKARGVAIAILSNGTPEMLRAAVESAGLADLEMPLFSVEPLGIYKPDAKVYRLVTDHYDVAPEEISFQSSNAWDIAGGRAFGYRAVWINRTEQPDEYGLRGEVPELSSLEGLAEAL